MVLPEWLISVTGVLRIAIDRGSCDLSFRATRSPHPAERRAYVGMRNQAPHEPGTV